jgi:hypothetical protein
MSPVIQILSPAYYSRLNGLITSTSPVAFEIHHGNILMVRLERFIGIPPKERKIHWQKYKINENEHTVSERGHIHYLYNWPYFKLDIYSHRRRSPSYLSACQLSHRSLFSSPLHSKRLGKKNPLFEVISLQVPMDTHGTY